jgi:hypothetical protein
MSKDRRKAKSGGVPSAIEILEQEDFFDLWTEKMFLGQEFLTWLWLSSEENGRVMRLPDGQEVEVWFENKLQLALGNGQSKRSVSITTPEEPTDSDWREAYTAIEQNKKVIKGTLRVKSSGADWRLTLPHDTLGPQGIKLSKAQDAQGDEEEGRMGKVLERLASTAELVSILEGLFAIFIKLRVSPEWETVELARLKAFLGSQK